MTSIIIWRNREPNQDDIWAVADSRVSSDVLGTYTLTDEAPKLFSLTVQCFMPPPAGGTFSERCYYGSIGIAFAGSTLIAHSTVLAISPVLENLSTLSRPPELHEIALFIQRFLKRYTMAVNQSSTRAKISEMAVFGRSPTDNCLQAFHIKPIPNRVPFELEVVEVDLTPEDSMLVLGDCKRKIRMGVDAERDQFSERGIAWWRSPLRALKRVVGEGAYPTIGGTVQLGITNGNRFALHWSLSPPGPDSPTSSMKYLGIDMHECQVGPCMMGMSGMA